MSPNRDNRRFVLPALALAAGLGAVIAQSRAANPGPDLIIASIPDATAYGTAPGTGIYAFDLGTNSCNVGNVNIRWQAATPQHPVIAQNIYRLRSGRFEQTGTPSEVFERPATEYVADFIGLSNRLPFERVDGGFRLFDGDVHGDVLVPHVPGTVVFRLRPEDLHLAPDRESLAGMTTFSAAVIDSQFGGRHYDVTVSVGTTRLQARVPADASGGWAKSFTPGQAVIVGFRSATAKAYGDEEGSRLLSGDRMTAVVSTGTRTP